MAPKSLTERLSNHETILVAEGYIFECERRGYLQAGTYVPEVILEKPEVVKNLHEEFVHAGSDVVEAFTYYCHREKMREIGREFDVEQINRTALRLARQVADQTDTLMAGNLCNTNLYNSRSPKSWDQIRAIFKEQICWAVEEHSDFIITETFSDLGEAKLALQAVKEYGNGIPCVVTLGQHNSMRTRDGVTFGQACRELENMGATVVGLNCSSGPKTMIPIIRHVRHACSGPIAALPVAFRTNVHQPQMQNLTVPETNEPAFPLCLDYFACTCADVKEFGRTCQEIGVQYAGLCCGNSSRYFRALAESFDRRPSASRYSTVVEVIPQTYGNAVIPLPRPIALRRRSLIQDYKDRTWPSTV